MGIPNNPIIHTQFVTVFVWTSFIDANRSTKRIKITVIEPRRISNNYPQVYLMLLDIKVLESLRIRIPQRSFVEEIESRHKVLLLEGQKLRSRHRL